MDGYRLGQLLNTIGNGIKNGIITDIEDSAEFVAFLFKAPVDIILKAIELLGKGEEMKAQALFDPEFFSNSREPNQEVLAFVEGIQGRPKPTGPTPDEIDAENEAKAAEVAVADRVSRPSVFSRRVDTTKSEEKTSQELQDEAYAQYKKDGKLDSYLDKIAEIEADIDLGGLSIYQRGQLADGLTYYGLGDDPFLESYRASVGGDPDMRPLYNYGIADTFLENVPPERVIDYQIALVNAGFLGPGTYNAGQYDDATKEAVEAAFTYMNPKGEFGISKQDLFDIASATQGNNNAFLGFVRDFFLDGLDDIEFTDTISAYSRASVIPLPSSEFLLQQISTQGKNYLGVPLNQLDLQAAEAFARGEIARLTKIQSEAELQYQNQLRQAETDALRREKEGLPAKDYFIEQPPSGEQITQALGYGVDNYLQTQFADLVGTQQEDNAYRQGLGRIINAFGANR
mgnify:FL=1|tara:strand:- start:43 stop:1413 length:1371 start_codon:yes stop_codon:yes gene_type:complete